MTNEEVIIYLQTKGVPFMAKFGEEGSIFFGTDDELKILMVLAIASRANTLEEQDSWINEISQALEEYSTKDHDI